MASRYRADRPVDAGPSGRRICGRGQYAPGAHHAAPRDCRFAERFIGILIEHYAGAMPLWLSPVQVSVLNISDAQADYVQEVTTKLRKAALRVQADLRNEKITYKIREHSVQKLPYILVIGDKERDANTVAVRARGNVDLGVMSVDALIERLKLEVDTKA